MTCCTKLFYHAGDLGDVIYGLIVMKLMGGGQLFLGPEHELGKDLAPRVGVTWSSYAFLVPLLRRQPYVSDVQYVNKPFCTHDLNTFRHHWRGDYVPFYERQGWKPPYSLQRMHLAAFGLTANEAEPWLSAEAKPEADVVVARSARYHNAAFPWKRVVDKYRGRMLFVGLPEEHKAFCDEFQVKIRYRPVRDAADLASVVAGAKLFVGNQSMPYAIAEGLKARTVQETRMEPSDGQDCLFDRPGAVYGRDENVTLPDL